MFKKETKDVEREREAWRRENDVFRWLTVSFVGDLWIGSCGVY